MKNYYLFLLVLCLIINISSLEAQVIISDTPSTTSNSSAILELQTTNKVLVLPSSTITDLNNPNPVTNPKEGLIYFNSNSSAHPIGPYYWEGNRWKGMVGEEYLTILKGKSQAFSKVATTGVVVTGDNPNENYTGASEPLSDWVEIPGTTLSITPDQAINTLSVTIGGGVQINNTAAVTLEYAVALFLDDVFITAKPILAAASQNCTYNTFVFSHSFSNLSIAPHTLKVRVRNRDLPNSGLTDASISYGQIASGCTNLSNSESRISINAIFNQP